MAKVRGKKSQRERVFDAFAGPMPKALSELGTAIPSDFGGFVKLNSEDRIDKYFFGNLLTLPCKRKVKGFKTPPVVCKIMELEALQGTELGEVEILCSSDLANKLSKCKVKDTVCIYYLGEQEIGKGNPMLLFQVVKLSKKFTGLEPLGLTNKVK